MSKTIGVLTSGGDCPGLNAVLRGVVCAAKHPERNWKVIGFKDGYEGLLGEDMFMELTLANTEGITAHGGTILGTTNRGHFVSKVGGGNKSRISDEVIAKTKAILKRLEIDALIESEGLKQVSDSGFIETMIDEVLKNNQAMVDEYRSGKEKAFNALVGQIMKASQGKANPGQVNELLKKKLS